MTVIRLTEHSHDGAGAFRIRVGFGDESAYDVDISDPATEADEENLAWYFQEHLRYPFLDGDRERAAVAQLAAYGENLFAQVFGGAASFDYRTLRNRSFDGCRLEVTGSAALHRLHWEALRDPDLPRRPLALWLPVTRRVAPLPSRFALPGPQPTLNICLVTARPDGPRDVAYRTISRPLLDALRTARLRITVDLVRPGTWRALTAHLRSVKDQHGTGWYHVVHFDVHGLFAEFGPMAEERDAGRLLFSPGTPEPFAGKRGFLFFETKRDGVAEPVPAENVAALLAEHRVPVAVLNACQSAMQSSGEVSLAQQLAEAGVPVTLGMAYSVTVSAAAQAMPVLYGRLAGGADPVAAVHAARESLYEHRGRMAYFDHELDLEDWLLPVMFGQRPLSLKTRDLTRDEQTRFYGRGAQVGDEPATEYGFVGRDLDIQAAERRLLTGADSNELLVQGMAGAGKSALLAHLAWWWQGTGLVDQVFRFSYEDRAWTRDQIVRGIRPTLFGPAEHAQADDMPADAQAEQVAERLRSQRHLLILDNAESITAAPAAIPHALAPDERRKLKSLLSRLRGGRTLVLLGSRGPETWLTSGHAGLGVYHLRGLDPQAASVLENRILARHGADHYLTDGTERPALDELATLLSGYPLPLTVVLPVLASAAPSQVLTELRAGGAGADPEGLVSTAIEYSHGKLDPVLQNSLVLLAPFTGVIGTGSLLQGYQDLLLADETVRKLGPIGLAAALRQAVSMGLAAPHPELTAHVQLQPVLPYFLRSRLAGQPALRAACAQAHYELYAEFGLMLVDMLGLLKGQQERATGHALTRAHFANLTAALHHALDTSQSTFAIIGPLHQHLLETRQYASLRKLADDAIARHPAPGAPARQRELAYLHSIAGQAALEQHDFDAAKAYFETELTLLAAVGAPESEHLTYHQLGRVAQGQERYADAEAHYRRALDLQQEHNKRADSARTYASLGTVVHEQHRYVEAEALYHQAIALYQEFGNWYESADVYGNLGRLAQAQRRYEEAETLYRSSIGLYQRFGDSYASALANVTLGTVVQAQGRYADAEALYRSALDVFLEVGDQRSTADVHFQLASATRELGRYEQSETHCRQAIDIYQKFGDRHYTAMAYGQLGVLAQARGRPEEATASYQQALGMFLEAGDQYNAALVYHNLGLVVQELGRYDEAEANYRQALEIRRESDPEAACRTALELGILLGRRGRRAEAVEALLYAAATWHRVSGQWYDQALQWLHRERELMEPDEFAALVAEIVPAPQAGRLIAATDAAGDPGYDGANGAAEPAGSSEA